MCEQCNNKPSSVGYPSSTNTMVDPEIRSTELMEELGQFEVNLESFAQLLSMLENKASSVIRDELSRENSGHPIPQRMTTTGRRLQNSNQSFETLNERLNDIIKRIEA